MSTLSLTEELDKIIKQIFSLASSNESLRNHKAITMEEWFADQDSHLIAADAAIKQALATALRGLQMPESLNSTNSEYVRGYMDSHNQDKAVITAFAESLVKG